MNAKKIFLFTAVVVLAISGCKKKDNGTSNRDQKPGGLSVRLVREIDGFSIPECFVIDTSSGDTYVSNIVTADEGYWVDDSNGFISRLDSEGNIQELKWLTGTEEVPIHAPKGMTILDGYLYFTDNTKLKRVALTAPEKIEQIELPATQKLNDLATDGISVWVTDTGLGKAYKVETDGSYKEISAPESINGITCWKGKVFAVSWDLHEIYELDPSGAKDPQPFGIASHFTNLDGIEVLENGIFVVSDFVGNQVAAVMPDRKTVVVLAEAESAADIAIDRQCNLLYVPLFLTSKARIYEIEFEAN